MTREDDLATGSARSVTGFDVYSAIKSCRDLLINFGGHTYAAGLTLKWKDVPEFMRRFQNMSMSIYSLNRQKQCSILML